MKPMLRVMLYAMASVAFIGILHPGEWPVLTGLAVFGAVCLFASTRGWLHPWSHGSAWVATIGAMFWARGLDTSAPVQNVVVFGGVLALLLVALHATSSDAPPVAVWRSLVVWGVVAGVAVLAVWLPTILSAGERVALLDPLTPTGAAVRFIFIIAMLVVATTAWVLGSHGLEERRKRRLRSKSTSDDAAGVNA